MAQKIVTHVTCDVCPAENATEAVDFVTLSYRSNEITYGTREIDVCAEHLAEIEHEVAPWMAYGHQQATAKKASSRTKRGGPQRNSQRAVREWAKSSGYSLGERGRIPVEVREAFIAAHYPEGAPA